MNEPTLVCHECCNTLKSTPSLPDDPKPTLSVEGCPHCLSDIEKELYRLLETLKEIEKNANKIEKNANKIGEIK